MSTHTTPAPSLSLLRQWETLADEAIADAGYWKGQAKDILAALEDQLENTRGDLAAHLENGETESDCAFLVERIASMSAAIARAKGVQS
jgi:hypothetical protein